MNSHLPDDPGLSHESWRPKFYGLIKEGHKMRVSQGALKVGLIFIGIVILGCQIIISWGPNKKSKGGSFKAPAIAAVATAFEKTTVPPVTDGEKELRNERLQREKRIAEQREGSLKIERIKPILLSPVKEIPSGAEVMAYLSSGGSNGLVKAVLSTDLKSDGDTLLPKGTVLIGKGSSSEERLYIQFSKAVSPDKTALKIKAFAFDKEDRIIGLKGKKISDYAFKLAASAGLIFLGGMADGLRDDYSSNPFNQRKPSMKDAALNGVSTASMETGKDLINDVKNSQARVEVASSTPILIIFGDAQ